MEIHDNLAIARRYIEALATPDGDPIAFYADDIVQEEFPNRLVPKGTTRDLAALREGRRRGRGLMRDEQYDEHNAIARRHDGGANLFGNQGRRRQSIGCHAETRFQRRLPLIFAVTHQVLQNQRILRHGH